jgi:hypothetical protein
LGSRSQPQAHQLLPMGGHTNALSGNGRICCRFFGNVCLGLQVRRLQQISQGPVLSVTPLRTPTALSIVWDSSLESGAESRKIDKKIFRKVPCGPRDREFPLVQGPVSDFANDLRIYPRAMAVSKKFSCGHHFCRNRRVQPDEQ